MIVNRPSNAIGSIEALRSRLPTTATDGSTIILTVAPEVHADAASVVDVIGAVFLNGPTWSWAFPYPAARKRWWEFCIESFL